MNLQQISPCFDPPYESPLEEEFAWNIVKYLRNDVTFEKQVEVDTICGRFRIDFVCRGTMRIGFECDGQEYHDKCRDEWRDAMILGDDQLDVIFRLRGQDLHYHMTDCLYLLSRWEPSIFSGRGHGNLAQLASPRAKLSPIESNMLLLQTEPMTRMLNQAAVPFLCLRRETRHLLRNRRAYEFARKSGGGNLDGLIQKWQAELCSKIVVVDEILNSEDRTPQ